MNNFQKELENIIQYESDCLLIEELIEDLSLNIKDAFYSLIHLDDIRSDFLELIYIYFTYDVNSLFELNQLSETKVYEIVSKLDTLNQMRFTEFFMEITKNIYLQIEDHKVLETIKKHKRTNYELKKKLEQPKIVINTSEFAERYGFSQSQQKGLRGKLLDPLPFICTNGKTIHYKIEEIEKWLENYKKVNRAL